jgi:DNA-binding transcriptional MerR regulator
VARAVNETVVTIRHWTDEGLLQLADRTESGYRLYKPEAVERAKQIRELQQQRFTLTEIKQKLA